MSEVKVLSSEFMPLIKELLDEGKSVKFKISGNSMLPFLKHQQTLVTVTKKDTYLKHDTILYKNKDKYILHRIIKVKDNFYLTCGDALKTIEYIPKAHVLGFLYSYEVDDEITYHNSKLYKFKVNLWVFLKPLRQILLKLFFRK